jgi:hypothetical protein
VIRQLWTAVVEEDGLSKRELSQASGGIFVS